MILKASILLRVSLSHAILPDREGRMTTEVQREQVAKYLARARQACLLENWRYLTMTTSPP